MNYFILCLRKYAVFEGRARRREYWMFVLYCTAIGMLLRMPGTAARAAGGTEATVSDLVASFFYLATLPPTITAAVRRMHDVGKSGWFMLIPIYNFILAIRNGDAGDNRYGADPKQPGPDL